MISTKNIAIAFVVLCLATFATVHSHVIPSNEPTSAPATTEFSSAVDQTLSETIEEAIVDPSADIAATVDEIDTIALESEIEAEVETHGLSGLGEALAKSSPAEVCYYFTELCDRCQTVHHELCGYFSDICSICQ